jgi:hypothetical protein
VRGCEVVENVVPGPAGAAEPVDKKQRRSAAGSGIRDRAGADLGPAFVTTFGVYGVIAGQCPADGGRDEISPKCSETGDPSRGILGGDSASVAATACEPGIAVNAPSIVK